MSPSVNLATSELGYTNPSTVPSYYNTSLPRSSLATEEQFTYEAVGDQVTNHDGVYTMTEDIYQEIDQKTHYQHLNVNREIAYEGYAKPASGGALLSNS